MLLCLHALFSSIINSFAIHLKLFDDILIGITSVLLKKSSYAELSMMLFEISVTNAWTFTEDRYVI